MPSRANPDLSVPARDFRKKPVGGELGHGLAGVSDCSGLGLAGVGLPFSARKC